MIQFKPLEATHLSLLHKWLETPHVKAWWDSEIKWTAEAIAQKYSPYIHGNNISAFIIENDKTPIGYIQIYDAYAVEKRKPLSNLPEKLGGLDFYIGEESFLGKGLGAQILMRFRAENTQFPHILADPDQENSIAIKTYEKAGFTKFETQKDLGQIMMLATSNPVALVQFCMNHETPYRPGLYQLCYQELKLKKPHTAEEDLAFLHSLMGLGLSSNDKAYFEEGIRLSKKVKNVPAKTLFWFQMGLGNSIIRETPQQALRAFSKAFEIADDNDLGKSLKSLADHKIHSAKFLISRSTS